MCDSYFDDAAADAICKNMNYTRAIRWTNSHPDFISIKYRYNVRLAVRCSDSDWESCTSYLDPFYCDHTMDVLLSCRTKDVKGNEHAFSNVSYHDDLVLSHYHQCHSINTLQSNN